MSVFWLAGAIAGFELSGFLDGLGHFWLGFLPIVPAAWCIAMFKAAA
jgi:hypothetical protein